MLRLSRRDCGVLTGAAVLFAIQTVIAAETVVVFDPLLGSTVGILCGGTLTAEGYQPGGNGTTGDFSSNHIRYGYTLTNDRTAIQPEIIPRWPWDTCARAAPIPDGYIEVEVKGMDRSFVTAEGDPGFVGMYDGRGITEPCAYDSDFKSNFFRWNIHWRENRNAMKCVISCANNTPARIAASRAVYDSDLRDWSTEPTGSSVSWVSTQWHKLKIEWSGTNFKVYVDGVQKWSASGPNKYAPIRHRIWLGCAPGYADKYTAMIPGLTFRNFKLVALRDADIVSTRQGAAPLVPVQARSSGQYQLVLRQVPARATLGTARFLLDGRSHPGFHTSPGISPLEVRTPVVTQR